MEPMTAVWLVALILFGLVEAFTPQLVCIWFACGSLAALIGTLLGAPLWLQLLIFFAVSILLLIISRPLYRKYIAPGRVPTGTDALIGKEVPVTEEINNLLETGEIRVNGLRWSARSADEGVIIPKGSVVKILGVAGVKLLVTPKFQESVSESAS